MQEESHAQQQSGYNAIIKEDEGMVVVVHFLAS